MGILSWIVFGLIAGLIAKALHPGKDPGGWIITILIGIAGAMVGGWLFGAVLGWETHGWTLKSFIAAIVGAIILLALYRVISSRKSS
jgi:uncharacterized membrane protein YeaQ/YmgE (transglycosylase-associated protein family)